MIDFTKSLKFVLSFLFLTLLLSMFAGQKIAYGFLVLVFIGMLLVNSGKVNTILGGLKYE